MLQSIDTSVRETQALVLSPTRELATQIQSVILALGGQSEASSRAQRCPILTLYRLQTT